MSHCEYYYVLFAPVFASMYLFEFTHALTLMHLSPSKAVWNPYISSLKQYNRADFASNIINYI